MRAQALHPFTAEFVDHYGYGFGSDTAGRRYQGEVVVHVGGQAVLRIDHGYTSDYSNPDDKRAEEEQAGEVGLAIQGWFTRVEDMLAERERS